MNLVVGAHFSFIVLKQRNHEVKLPLARPHCPAMAGRRRAAEPAGVVPNTAPRWQAQKWSDPSRYANAIGNDQFHWKELNLLRDCLIYSDQFDPTPAEGSTQMSKKYRTYELRVTTERLLQNRDFSRTHMYQNQS